MPQRNVTISFEADQRSRLLEALKADMGNPKASDAEALAHLDTLASRLVLKYLRRIDRRKQGPSDLNIT